MRIKGNILRRVQCERRRTVDDRKFEQLVKRLMKLDFSKGTEAFRDALLERCLTVLDARENGSRLDDADLELLSAAGDDATYRGPLGTSE